MPELHTGNLLLGVHSFVLQDLTVSLFWHPRLDTDQAHRWLHGLVREICNSDV